MSREAELDDTPCSPVRSLVIANSQNTCGSMLLGDWRLPTEKVRLLHPGVTPGRFVPAARDEAYFVNSTGRGHTVLLTVGRLTKCKRS